MTAVTLSSTIWEPRFSSINALNLKTSSPNYTLGTKKAKAFPGASYLVVLCCLNSWLGQSPAKPARALSQVEETCSRTRSEWKQGAPRAPPRDMAVSPSVASSGSHTLATLFPGPAGSRSREPRAHLLLQGAVQPQKF